MNAYVYAADIVRVALIVGVVVSMLFYEKVQLTTGGAIVPAYLAVGLAHPWSVLLTLVAGWATWLIVDKVIGRRVILYGRRKFEVEVLVGLSLVLAVLALHLALGSHEYLLSGAAVIGYLVPGIIAHDMGRQGPKKTFLAVGATTAILGVFLFLFVALLGKVTGEPTSPTPELAAYLGYDRHLIPVAALVTVLLGMLVFAKVGCRTGGFISGAYLAFMLPRWYDMMFTFGIAFLTWFVVAKLLMPRLLVFGRRKLALMMLSATLIGWSAELVVTWATDGLYIPGRGLTVMTLVVPALVANDAQRQGWVKTLLGVGITTLGTYGIVNLVGAALLAIGF